MPEDLRPVIDQQEIRKNLGTVGHREAVRLSHIESVKADALFAEARAKPAGGTPDDTPALVSGAELQPLARSYLYGLEIEAPPVPLFQEEREARREAAHTRSYTMEEARKLLTVTRRLDDGLCRSKGRAPHTL